MGKSVGTAIVAMALLGASADSAQGAVYEGEFGGQPGSSIELTFVKKDGKRFLDSWSASYTTNCEPGPASQSTGWSFTPRVRVRDGHFRRVSGSPDSNEFFRLAGDLKRSGKAVGAVRYRTFIGTPYNQCDTGTLEWVAFKQPLP